MDTAISRKISRQKIAIAISDVRPTERDEVIEITMASDGRTVRLRRDQCEFFTGTVYVEKWLADRILRRDI